MKAKKLISWKVLDRYKTSRGIAAFLRNRKITGIRNDGRKCPLAEATGYYVSEYYRNQIGCPKKYKLTDAERHFVIEFDLHVYPNLERKYFGE